jgi:hypothetical protein
MKNKNKKINESITESAISPLSYIIFIDAATSIENSRGYLKMMFTDQPPSSIKTWFRPLTNSKSYDEVSDKLKAISTRFSNNPSLKALFNSLEKIKSSSYAESDREQHENDIELLIKKISLFIKRKLSESDVSVMETILTELNSVTESVSKEIDNQLDSLAIVAPEEPSEPVEKKQKSEVKVSERIKNKLRKKIKEIVRTHLFTNKRY